jgi:carboxymethylenebutenolidase
VGLPWGASRSYGGHQQRRLLDRDGRELPGHLDRSAGDALPAIVVVHDFYGLTDQIKLVTAQLAAAGFVAFAPDLYHGRVATTRDGAIALAQTIAWNRVAIELGLAVEALRDRSRGAPVAVCGFAMGGAAALVAAAAIDRIAAAVTFYGIPQDVAIDNRAIKVQGHFAARDQKCTRPRVEALHHALLEREVHHEFHVYEADNGFCNPTRTDAYAAPEADLAWQRTLGFLRAALH